MQTLKQKVVAFLNSPELRLFKVTLSREREVETQLRKECVVNATLLAKLVRPAEGDSSWGQVHDKRHTSVQSRPRQAGASFHTPTRALQVL